MNILSHSFIFDKVYNMYLRWSATAWAISGTEIPAHSSFSFNVAR